MSCIEGNACSIDKKKPHLFMSQLVTIITFVFPLFSLLFSSVLHFFAPSLAAASASLQPDGQHHPLHAFPSPEAQYPLPSGTLPASSKRPYGAGWDVLFAFWAHPQEGTRKGPGGLLDALPPDFSASPFGG